VHERRAGVTYTCWERVLDDYTQLTDCASYNSCCRYREQRERTRRMQVKEEKSGNQLVNERVFQVSGG
jgi:hypothetical protein